SRDWSSDVCSSDLQKAFVYMQNSVAEIEPAYGNDGGIVYLVDLRKMLPDSVVVNDKTYVTHLRSRIPPSVEYKYYSDDLNITFPASALYEDRKSTRLNSSHVKIS